MIPRLGGNGAAGARLGSEVVVMAGVDVDAVWSATIDGVADVSLLESGSVGFLR